ncbi:hypothetical protein [Phenylobacterium sp.]|mgnify:CR=1 FL=1|uniref:hypothetical protein n=1 Tax=Phenylobacterium sp. TaxID=1871053 RepID=UPI002FE32783
MTSNIRGWGAALTAAALAGCATASAPPERSATGAARADRSIEAQASAFESFMRRAGGIDAGFSGPGAVAQALQVGAGHDPKELQAGMIAYAAVAALQEPRFVDAVRRAGRGDLARRLAADPQAALALPGSEAAAARAGGALARQGEALAADGRKVKQASYSLQKHGWSKQKVPNAPARLARVKAISQAGYRPQPGDQAQLYRAVSEGGRRGGAASPVVARGVALAALSVLGEEARGRALMNEPRSGMCVRMAKLNLYQCLASAGPHYEDVYCLATHAMLEPAGCVTDAVKPPKPGVQKASYSR